MPTTYRVTLTNVGAALVADAIASGTTLTWAKMALGDGNGSAVTVDPSRTSLVSEQYRAPLNDLGRDSVNPNTIVGTLVVPPETGGWTIREFGIYDNASTPRLVAYGETPEIEKPASSAGTGINLRLRFKLIVSAEANITLAPDSNKAYATIEYVKDNAVKSLSVNGCTITYTMGDGDTHTIKTQDTTYDDATQSAHGLMSAADKSKLDSIDNTYLPLSGGTLTGNLVLANASVGITNKLTNSESHLMGGTDLTTGASFIAYGKDNANAGAFRVRAFGDYDLIGTSTGELKWKNNPLIPVIYSYFADYRAISKYENKLLIIAASASAVNGGSITFTNAFSKVPIVLCEHPGTVAVHAQAYNVTTTTFNVSHSYSSAVNIKYIAIGLGA